jgi:REP element-mobilizing transposase RayT
VDLTEPSKHHDNLPHWQRPGATYFIRSSTDERTAGILTQPEVAEIVVGCLGYDDGRLMELHCWVLMPDHMHMIMRPVRRNEGYVPVPEFMQSWKSASSHKINRLVGRSGAFWQDEYYCHMIRSSQSYVKLQHYVRMNPVEAGLVEDPDEWMWYWRRDA